MTRYLLPSVILLTGSIGLSMPAAADGAVCVTCVEPHMTYLCRLDSNHLGASVRARHLGCAIGLAKLYGHDSCSVKSKSAAGCTSTAREVVLDDEALIRAALGGGKKEPPNPTSPSDVPTTADVTPTPTDSTPTPDLQRQAEPVPEAPQAPPSEPPETLVDLTKQAVQQSGDQLKKAGEAVGSATKKTGEAVTNLLQKSMKCLSSLFNDC